MIKRERYEDRQQFLIRVGSGELLVERFVTYELATGNHEERHNVIRSDTFTVPELAIATASLLDGFAEVAEVVCERTPTGDLRPVVGPYGLMQLWAPVGILGGTLVAHAYRSNYVRLSKPASEDVSVCSGDLPKGKEDDFKEVLAAFSRKREEAGLELLSPQEHIAVGKSGRVRPDGAVPVSYADHLMQGVLLSLQQCPIKDGVVPVDELHRLRRLSKAIQDLFSDPRDLINQEQAAEIAGVAAATVRRWFEYGRLPCYGDDRRVSEAEFKRLLPFLRKRRPRTKKSKPITQQKKPRL